jgi:uncharacterized membrane protein
VKSRIDIALLTGAALWCAVIVAAPLFSIRPIYAFFSLICHQAPERSWFLLGQPLPVCIRCSAIYFGFLIALVAKREPNADWLKLAIAVTFAEVALEWLGAESVMARSVTGLALGATAAPFVRVGITEMFGVRHNAL